MDCYGVLRCQKSYRLQVLSLVGTAAGLLQQLIQPSPITADGALRVHQQ